MTYDPKAVDELLDALKAFGTIWAGGLQPEKTERLANAMNALRPPKRYYVLPEQMPAGVSLMFDQIHDLGVCGVRMYPGSLWEKLRQLTATDKPPCVIPAASEWDGDDIEALNAFWRDCFGMPTHKRLRVLIDAIKTKVENREISKREGQ